MSEDTAVKLSRGQLEAEVKAVCDRFVAGDIELPDGQLFSAHRIAAAIIDLRGPDSDRRSPSTGAIADNLKRWSDIGFAVLNEKPLAFSGYTDAAHTEGLRALKEKHAASRPSKPRKRKEAVGDVRGPVEGVSNTAPNDEPRVFVEDTDAPPLPTATHVPSAPAPDDDDVPF